MCQQNDRLFLRFERRPTDSGRGRFVLRNGSIQTVRPIDGPVCVESGEVVWTESGAATLEVLFLRNSDAYGPGSSVLFWESAGSGFAVLPGSVPADRVLQAPDVGLVIARNASALENPMEPGQFYEDAIDCHHLPRGREIGWDEWSKRNREPGPVPTVLGLSRDQRLFIVDPAVEGTVKASLDLTVPTVVYDLGRVNAPDEKCRRSLEEECLPILHARHRCGDLVIEETFFVTLADAALEERNVEGTPLLSSHLFSRGCQFPKADWDRARQEAESLVPAGEVVLFHRVRLSNRGEVPLLAPQALPRACRRTEPKEGSPTEVDYVNEQGLQPNRLDGNGVQWTGGRAHSLHRVNGMPPLSLQPCLLVGPGESMTVDSILAHARAGLSEATQSGGIPFQEKLAEARAFWRQKLRPAARVTLPEKRLADFWKAGLAHLELVTLGKSTAGPLLAKVGVYPPIGSESIPIVEFYDSVGLHDTARRCVEAFFALQQEDGRINLFAHYDIETGAALFLAGRHFAYTNDRAWAACNAPAIKSAADYVLRRRNTADPEAVQFGLDSGTCADPRDATTAFMLNAYNAAGLRAASILLQAAGDPDWERFDREAREYAQRFRKALLFAFSRGPLLPTAPRRWVPGCAPWAEGTGPRVMGLDDGGSGFSHRSYFVFDALLGPLYAVFAGLIDPEETYAQWLLEVNHRHYNRAGITESQPYYGRHPEVHLLRGEREHFLNAFYSGLTSLADRETFTFWEHFHHVSIHKTHEEGWALMQLRRMLWLEHRDELRLLPGIPEWWTDAGESIDIEHAHSSFGRFTFRLSRTVDGRTLQIRWRPDFHTVPKTVTIHVPGVSLPATACAGARVASPQRLEILNPGEPFETELILC